LIFSATGGRLGSTASGYNGDLLSASDWDGGYSSSTDYLLNCGGWRRSLSYSWGYVIGPSASKLEIRSCDSNLPVACCK